MFETSISQHPACAPAKKRQNSQGVPRNKLITSLEDIVSKIIVKFERFGKLTQDTNGNDYRKDKR